MLYLIGLGLWDEKDISVKGLEIARESDEVYLETYTSTLVGSNKEKLEALIGKSIKDLDRTAVEQEPEFLKAGKTKNVAVLVGGDPLVATTHSDLLLRARELGVEYKIIHSASIYSAIAVTGLHIYKFGKTATITFWEENFKPTSFYDAVKENKARGLHTLLLLDIKTDRKMTPAQGIEILEKIDPGFAEERVITCSRVGGEQQSIVYGKAGELKNRDFGEGLHVIVVPAELHDMEKEFLEGFE